MFDNRRNHRVVLKTSLGGEKIVKWVSKASEDRLKREIARIYKKQPKTQQKPSTQGSDEFYEQWKADNESNLIELRND